MIDVSNPLLILRDFLLLNFSTLGKVEDLEEEDTGDSTFIENYVQFMLETIVESWIERKLNTIFATLQFRRCLILEVQGYSARRKKSFLMKLVQKIMSLFLIFDLKKMYF